MDLKSLEELVYEYINKCKYGFLINEEMKELLIKKFIDTDKNKEEINEELNSLMLSFEKKCDKKYGEHARIGDVKELIDYTRHGAFQTKKVIFHNGYEESIGFLKKTNIDIIDNLEVVINQIGEAFDVKTAKIYRTIFQGKEMIISEAVNGEGEEYVDFCDVIKKYSLETEINLSDSPVIRKEDEIQELFELGVDAFQNWSNCSESNVDKFRHDYLRMMIFDYITNQRDRNATNIGIIECKDGSACLSPLIDNGCALTNPKQPNNNYNFNNKHCDRDCLMRMILNRYYDEVKQMSENIDLHSDEYRQILHDIIFRNLADNDANSYFNIVSKNLDNFLEMYSDKKKRVINKDVSDDEGDR